MQAFDNNSKIVRAGRQNGTRIFALISAILIAFLLPVPHAFAQQGDKLKNEIATRFNGDPAAARAGFKAGCEGERPAECRNLAIMHLRRLGGDRDDDEVRRVLRIGCRKQHLDSCYMLRFMSDKEPAEILAFLEPILRPACDNGDLKACHRLGNAIAEQGNALEHLKPAAKLYQRACDGKLGRGCISLGLMYGSDIELGPDHPRQMKLYQKGCDLGVMMGCDFLAGMLVAGYPGIPIDVGRALPLFEKACRNGYSSSCAELGHLYSDSKHVPSDQKRAAEYYRIACEDKRNFSREGACRALKYIQENHLGKAKK